MRHSKALPFLSTFFLQNQRKPIMKRNMLFLFSVLLFGVVLISCSTKEDKPSQSSQNSSHSIQEWIQVGDYDVFVHEIVEEQEVVDGKRLAYIEVEYANNRSEEELSCRRNQWYLYDEQGYSYEAETSRDIYDKKDLQYLGGDRFVNPNMKLRGWLLFQVPEDATIKNIQFITGFIGTETADIIFDEPK